MHQFFDWLTMALIVAIIYLMVRPRSQGPALVEKFGNAFNSIFSDITGGGGW